MSTEPHPLAKRSRQQRVNDARMHNPVRVSNPTVFQFVCRGCNKGAGQPHELWCPMHDDGAPFVTGEQVKMR